MLAALAGFALGWLLRGLWERRRAGTAGGPVETPAPAPVAPAAAFARGRPNGAGAAGE